VSSDARILDRGYRPYAGRRLGPGACVWSLIRHTAQRVMGIRRPARAKILPVMSAVIAYVPAIVFIGVAALIPEDRLRQGTIPTYGEYYGFIVSALIIFAALVAPEALCTDRRTGLLGLYLAAPLTRRTYVEAKVAAVGGLLAVATLGPPLLMLIAFVLQGNGPDGPGAVALLIVRVVCAGLMVAAIYTSVSLGVSSLTDRRAVASAATLLLLLVSGAVTGALVGGMGLPEWITSWNLSFAPFELAQRIYGEPGHDAAIPTFALVIGVGSWTLLGFVVLWNRYRSLRVTR
jgi:hypothetical protein